MRSRNYNLIRSNGICYFYHFTDVHNLDSIRSHGLWSRKYLEDNKLIEVRFSGDERSRQYDIESDTLDDVHLSFCSHLPMAWHIERTGRELVLISISIEIIRDPILNIRYSDVNVASRSARISDSVEHIDFDAVKSPPCRRDDPAFHKRQAEILVARHLSPRYIEKIERVNFGNSARNWNAHPTPAWYAPPSASDGFDTFEDDVPF